MLYISMFPFFRPPGRQLSSDDYVEVVSARSALGITIHCRDDAAGLSSKFAGFGIDAVVEIDADVGIAFKVQIRHP